MFALLRRKFGAAALVLPLMALMGIMFHGDPKDVRLGAVLMCIVTLALLMLDDVFVFEFADNGALLSEEELVEIDKLVSPAQITVEVQYH